jgi:hypothetical protein
LVWLVLSGACMAQAVSPRFEEEHARGVKQNPRGLKLVLGTADGHTIYRLSDTIRFRLSFASQQLRRYTADLASAGSRAGASNDFVIEGPDMAAPIHSDVFSPPAIVCCSSDRRYVKQKPLASEASLQLKWLERGLGLSTSLTPRKFKPGVYAIFAQTRSVMVGWPKSEHDRYHTVSNLVVTSSNILRITILPDASDSEEDKR